MGSIHRFQSQIKKLTLLVIVFSLVSAAFGVGTGRNAEAQNPFTTRPEQQQKAPPPVISNPLYLKLALWQQQLREFMSFHIRNDGGGIPLSTLLFLAGAGILYGALHAAGPGHGKVFALSYLIAGKKHWSHALLLGNMIAYFHAVSAVVIVLILRLVLNATVSGTLETVSHKIQLVSYMLITAVGLILLVAAIRSWFSMDKNQTTHPSGSKMHPVKTTTATAFFIGMAPCPAVVLVMLFCLSMGELTVGLFLAFFIATGMAATISMVTLLAQWGKKGLERFTETNAVKGSGLAAFRLNLVLETLGALMIFAVGALFTWSVWPT